MHDAAEKSLQWASVREEMRIFTCVVFDLTLIYKSWYSHCPGQACRCVLSTCQGSAGRRRRRWRWRRSVMETAVCCALTGAGWVFHCGLQWGPASAWSSLQEGGRGRAGTGLHNERSSQPRTDDVCQLEVGAHLQRAAAAAATRGSLIRNPPSLTRNVQTCNVQTWWTLTSTINSNIHNKTKISRCTLTGQLTLKKDHTTVIGVFYFLKKKFTQN